MKKEQYIIKGMTCSACSATIQNNVSKKNGVKTCNVNLLSEKIDIEFDEKLITENDIFNLITSLGYKPYALDTKFEKNIDTSSKLKRNFFLSLFFLIPLLYLTMGHMIGIPLPKIIDPSLNPICFSVIQLILSVPIIIINFHFYLKGFKLIFKLAPNMDSLVALGSTASLIYSLWLTIDTIINYSNVSIGHSNSMNLFYESAVMILVLVTLGKWLESRSKKKTNKAIEELYKFIPDTVTIEINGIQKIISVNELQIGDIVIVKQDEYIPIDGTIIDGHSYIDKSAITGESMAVEVNVGDYVTSATINKNGFLKIKVEKIKGDTTIAQIIKMVQEAGSSKAPIEKFADKISLYFVPIVIGISLFTFIIWIFLSKDISLSINNAICVLVISCPCALGLATPIAIMVATGKGAKLGILFKDAESLQKARKINMVLFDKTGTLTIGKPSVIECISFSNLNKREILEIAYSLESLSNHPLANAINELAVKEGINQLKIADFSYLKGMGSMGKLNNICYSIGNLKLCQKQNVTVDKNIVESLENKYIGKTIIYLSTNKIIGAFIIADTIKNSSKEAIKKLHENGIKTALITGDAKPTAEAIANELNIEHYEAEVLPSDKLELVKKYQEKHIVAFVGDGINDSPALKEANIGIAVSTGNDIAIDCADVVLTNQDLVTISTMIRLSKKTVNNIKLNLFWAFFYNVIGIFIATGSLSSLGINLTPMIGAAAMSLSSLFVVTNALRLQNFKIKKEKEISQVMKKTVTINGMMCMHCAARVENALKNLDGVEKVTINLKKKFALVESTKELNNEEITKVITEAGYEVVKIA